MELIRHGLEIVAIIAFLATCYTISYVFQYFARRFLEESEDGPPFFPLARMSWKKKPKKANVIRGQPLVTLDEAKKDLEKNAPPPEVMPRTFFHSGLWLSRKEETNNLLVLATIGSGKSLLAGILEASQLKRIHAPINGEVVGAVVYDYKRQSIPLLAGIVGPERVLNLNPFAEGSVAPDLPAMFDTEARAFGLAESLTSGPEHHPHNGEPFWIEAPRDLITAVIMVFNALGGCWELRDILEAIATLPRLIFILGKLLTTERLIGTYLSEPRMANSLMAAMRASTRPYRPVAAIYAKTARRVNLKEFVEKLGYVLVFQPDHEKRTASMVIQRLILTRLFEYALNLDDSDQRRLFLYLDEIQEMKRLELLSSILATGRSKGICVCLFSQTIDGLLKEYGEEELGKMLDNVSTKTFFRASGKTAEWIAKQFGSLEIERYLNTKVDSETKKDGDAEKGSTKSRSQHFHTMDVLQASEVSAMPPPSPERGLTSININRLTRPFYATLKDLDKLIPRPMAGISGFTARPNEDEVLEPWTVEDLKRLNLTIGPNDDLAAILGTPPEHPLLPPAALTELVSAPKVDDGITGKLIGKLKGLVRGGDS